MSAVQPRYYQKLNFKEISKEISMIKERIQQRWLKKNRGECSSDFSSGKRKVLIGFQRSWFGKQ